MAEELEGNQSYVQSRGVLVNDTSLMVDLSYLVVGDQVTLANGEWTVSREVVSSHFQMSSCEYVTEGKTLVDASSALVKNVSINLEGESEASVWATESIPGKGEGQSALYYKPFAGLDLTGFELLGNAQLIPFL